MVHTRGRTRHRHRHASAQGGEARARRACEVSGVGLGGPPVLVHALLCICATQIHDDVALVGRPLQRVDKACMHAGRQAGSRVRRAGWHPGLKDGLHT